MTQTEFLKQVKHIADNETTIYMYGTYGQKITETLIRQKAQQYPDHYSAAKQRQFRALIGKGYGFDCVGLIKGVLWGWPNPKYKANNVPDTSANGMINLCKNVSTNFNRIKIGDAVWVTGHIGIYIGNGLVIEACPRWDNKVQYSTLGNLGIGNTNYPVRNWTKYGTLPFFEGGEKMTILRHGSRGTAVKTLQENLNKLGYSAGAADSIFGDRTKRALEGFQRDRGLTVDGIYGARSDAAMKQALDSISRLPLDYKKLYEDLLAKVNQVKNLLQ